MKRVYSPIMCRVDCGPGHARRFAKEMIVWSQIVNLIADRAEKESRLLTADEVWLCNRSTAEVNGLRWKPLSQWGDKHEPSNPAELVQSYKDQAAEKTKRAKK